MKVGFHCDSFSLRGVTVATFAYAQMWQDWLGNESILIRSDGQTPWIRDRPLSKHVTNISILRYSEPGELNTIISRNRIDALYVLTTGQPDARLQHLDVPLWVHAVFPSQIDDIHGTRYACVSDWLAKESFNHRIPYVPHIVNTPKHIDSGWRERHGIPADAIVIGSMGGTHSFDLAIARNGLKKAIDSSSHLYFVSLNHAPFLRHKQALFLKGTDDLLAKSSFINACDAMLHGRAQGETFGLACAEFTAAGKPVFAWRHAPERHHLVHFCVPSLQYSTASELSQKLLYFDGGRWSKENLERCCLPFRSEAIAPQFSNVFADKSPNPTRPHFSTTDRALIFKRRLQRSLRARISRSQQLPPDEACLTLDPISGFPMEE